MSKGQGALEVLFLLGGMVLVGFLVLTMLLSIANQIPAKNSYENFPEPIFEVGDCVAGDFFHSPSETSELRIGTVAGFFVENFKLNVIVDLTNPESFGYRNYVSVDDSSLKKISRRYCRVLE